MVGTRARRALRRVRRRDEIARLEEACRAAGRDPASIGRLVLSGPVLDAGLASRDAFDETIGRYAEAGVSDFVVHWPRPGEPYAGSLRDFERIFADRVLPLI